MTYRIHIHIHVWPGGGAYREHWGIQHVGWNISTPGVAEWLAKDKTHAHMLTVELHIWG